MTTLDGKERVLTAGDMLITSGGEPIAIADMGEDPHGDPRGDTRAVVLESASFLRVGHGTAAGHRLRGGVPLPCTVDPTLSARPLPSSS